MGVTWLPEGYRSVVRVTAIGKTMSGWQCRVRRRQVDATGQTVPSGVGEGFLYVDTLLSGYERLTEGES